MITILNCLHCTRFGFGGLNLLLEIALFGDWPMRGYHILQGAASTQALYNLCI